MQWSKGKLKENKISKTGWYGPVGTTGSSNLSTDIDLSLQKPRSNM